MKGIATSITTAVLLIVSTLFFNIVISYAAMAGCAVVFLSSYSYIKAGMKPATGPIVLADGRVISKVGSEL